MKRQTAVTLACYATIYVVWGSTYYFIRSSVATIPAGWVLAIRWTIGGCILMGYSLVRGKLRTRLSFREVISSIILGVLLLLLGNGGITLAERSIDSYLGALLASSTPILVAVFDGLLLRKRMTLARVLGVVFGCVGVAVFLYNGHSVGSTLSPAVIIGLFGAVSWALATSLGHRFAVSGDNTVNSGIQMLFVGVITLVGSLLFGPPVREVARAMSAASLFGVLYLAVIGSLAFSAFTYLVAREPAERLVSYALVNPLIALVIGLGLAGEAATPYLGVGVPLVLVGLACMLYGERFLARVKPRARTSRRSATSRRSSASRGSPTP